VVNCCLNVGDPKTFVSIGYYTDQINPGDTLGLTVENADKSCGGENYTWEKSAGGGSLSAETGLDVIYTAPADGADCPGNTTITLYCGGEVVDTLVITINYNYAIEFDYDTSGATVARNNSVAIAVIANNTPLTWSVSGTGFSLEHAETAGVGNILHADAVACGSATITCTGCDGSVAIGYVRCTTGSWQSTVSNACILRGVAGISIGDRYYEAVQGKYKQTVRVQISIDGTNPCSNKNCISYCFNLYGKYSCLKIPGGELGSGTLECDQECWGNGYCDSGYCANSGNPCNESYPPDCAANESCYKRSSCLCNYLELYDEWKC